MSAETRPLNLDLPNSRLLIVASGSFAARHVPTWVEAIRHWYPGTNVRVLVTESALKFVTTETQALHPIQDTWTRRGDCHRCCVQRRLK
ncbi:hypothetical protein GCM10028800_19270 [Nesterenkonia populi]